MLTSFFLLQKVMIVYDFSWIYVSTVDTICLLCNAVKTLWNSQCLLVSDRGLFWSFLMLLFVVLLDWIALYCEVFLFFTVGYILYIWPRFFPLKAYCSTGLMVSITAPVASKLKIPVYLLDIKQILINEYIN